VARLVVFRRLANLKAKTKTKHNKANARAVNLLNGDMVERKLKFDGNEERGVQR